MEDNPYNIDWTLFDQDPEATCYCRCGTVFRSHAKYLGAISKVVSRKPCPGCGNYANLRKVSSDPETFDIRR